MKRDFIIIILCLISFQQGNGQSYLFTDFGNTILLRPNIGYEKKSNNRAVSGLLMWKRSDGVWATEFPEIMRSNGIRADFSYKFFAKKLPKNYIEIFTRYQFIKTDSVFYYDPSYDANRRKLGFEFGPRIRNQTASRNGQFVFDFCIGLGYGFYKIKDKAINPIILTNETYAEALERTQLVANRHNRRLRKYAMPYAQFRIYYKICS